jgi:hypothetical protein
MWWSKERIENLFHYRRVNELQSIVQAVHWSRQKAKINKKIEYEQLVVELFGSSDKDSLKGVSNEKLAIINGYLEQIKQLKEEIAEGDLDT